MKAPLSLSERFWAKVEKTDGCWIWRGRVNRKSYGRFDIPDPELGWDRTLSVQAHRFAYEQLVGKIHEGLQLDHLCRNRRCVNAEHLEPVTCRVNVLRGEGISAQYAVATHCVNGHEFTPENTYLYRGKRDCRECNRLRRAS